MRYTGQDCTVFSHNQDGGKVSCTGDAAFTDPVFFKAGDSDDPNDADAGRFGSGNVALNGLFDIDATLDGEDRLKSETHVHLFSAATMALLASIEFHTSCSQPLAVGDQFGPLIIEGYTPDP